MVRALGLGLFQVVSDLDCEQPQVQKTGHRSQVTGYCLLIQEESQTFTKANLRPKHVSICKQLRLFQRR